MVQIVRKILIKSLLSVIPVAFISSVALAQETNLEAINIYGAKNAQTLDDSTSSIGIVTSEDIANKELSSFRDAFRTLANVGDSDWPDGGFTIRGINSEGLVPGGAPLAGFYIDGIQQTGAGTRRGARGLWDVEQVEVYRGPQSTLTGRAALAGAIYVKTKDPTYDTQAAIQGTVGSLDTRDIAVMINAPIVNNQLAIRLSAEYSSSKNDINYPTFEHFALYDEFIEDEYYQLRGKVLFEPAALPGLRALLTYSFAHDSPHGDDIGGPVLGFNFSDRRGDFSLPTFIESRSADNHNAGLELTHDLTQALRFTSMTSYSKNKTLRPSVNLGTAGETNVVIGDDTQELLTQEIRLNYNAGPMKAVVGTYLAFEDQQAGFVRPNFFGFASDVSKSSNKSRNVAGFGEITYEFAPSWKIIVGGRADYTETETSQSFVRTFFGGGSTVTGFAGEFDELVFLPKAGLTKEFSSDQSVSFIVQRGFRNGGAGVQRSTGEVFSFDPSFAWNYELGYKGKFLNNRLNVSANLFYMEWSNQQVEVQEVPGNNLSNITTNAASSVSQGFELEGRYQATPAVSIFASLGYSDTEFKEFVSANLGDLAGFPFPEAPKWNVAFGAEYKNDQGYYMGFDAKFTDEYLARFGTNPQEFLDGYFIANAQIGYDGEHLGLKLFATNIFDKEYFVYNDNDIAATLGARRVVGLRASVKY